MRYRLFIVLLAIAFRSGSASAQAIISTVAGNGITQYIGDGYPATAFSLAAPAGICVDAHQNVIIADFADMRIRMVNPQDTLFTIVGDGTSGFSGDSGIASAARVHNPIGVCQDTAGNLYITDWYNNAIRKVNVATGIITTICGGSASGFGGDGAAATAAILNNPGPACTDRLGNVYIPDQYNHRVRKIDALTGIITTVAGNGTSGYMGDDGAATAAELSYPNSVSCDTAGNLYISENGNNCIRRVDAATGVISTYAGNGSAGYFGDGGLAAAAKLHAPSYVFADRRGNVYISDYDNNVVRMVDSALFIHTIAGTGAHGYAGDGGAATAATMLGPMGIYVTDSGVVYFADQGNSAIRKITPSTTAIHDLSVEMSVVAYPNPAHDLLYINIAPGPPATLRLYNQLGVCVFGSVSAQPISSIDVSRLARGTYYLWCMQGGSTATRKFILD